MVALDVLLLIVLSIILFCLVVVSLGVSLLTLLLLSNILFSLVRSIAVKNIALVAVLLGFSSLAYAGADDGLHGCETKKLVTSIPTVDMAKSVQICHVNGLTFNLKYGINGKPEIDFNFMGLKSGGFVGEENSTVIFATKGDYRYTLNVGKEISDFTVEYKKGNKYQKVEQARLVNNLNKSQSGYWDKFIANTNYKANNIEVK